MDNSSNDSDNYVIRTTSLRTTNAIRSPNISLNVFFARLRSFQLNILEEYPTDYSSSQTEGDNESEEVEGSVTEDMSDSSSSNLSGSSFSNISVDSTEYIQVSSADETAEPAEVYNDTTDDTESLNSVETLVNEPESEPDFNSDNNSDNAMISSVPSTEDDSNDEQNVGNIEIVPQNTAPDASESSEEEIIKCPSLSKRKRIGSESPSPKRVKSESDSDEDDGRICPICLDYWTNSGEHRLCALKCGHLFGQKCIKRWLQSQAQKSCPTCKTKATIRDLRPIFAKKILVTDKVSIDNLKAELESVKNQRSRLSYDVSRLTTVNKSQQITIQQQATKIFELQQALIKNECTDVSDKEQSETVLQITFEKTLELSKDDGCRVMAYNLENLLVVSLKSPNQLFTGYGVRKIKINDYSVTQFVPLHTKLIRDLAFHPQTGEWLLSVSLDKTAKLTNIANNTVLNTFVTDMPLWSCCWDSNDPNLFYVGGQRGIIFQFDIRNPSEPAKRLVTPSEDMTSVVAIISVNSGDGDFLPQGGLICCKLNSCWVFEQLETGCVPKKVNLEGPFVSLNYNETRRQVLISIRPNPRWVFCRHILCDLVDDGGGCLNVRTVQYFQGGTTQTHLSRNCQIELPEQNIVLCYQETKRQINVWSTRTGYIIQTIPAPDPVIDMCYVKIRNQLIALTEKRIRIYNIV